MPHKRKQTADFYFIFFFFLEEWSGESWGRWDRGRGSGTGKRIKVFQLPIIHEHDFKNWFAFVHNFLVLYLIDVWSVISPRDVEFLLLLGVVPHEISPIFFPVSKSIGIVLGQVLFRQPYRWGIMDEVSLPFLRYKISQQFFQSSGSYTTSTSILWCSPSYRCRSCVLDVSLGVRQPMFTCSLSSC